MVVSPFDRARAAAHILVGSNRAPPARARRRSHSFVAIHHPNDEPASPDVTGAAALAFLGRRNSLRLSQVLGTTRIHRRKDRAKTQRRKEPNRLALQKSLRLCAIFFLLRLPLGLGQRPH